MPKCCCSINNESVNYIGDSEVRDCVTRSIVEVVARAALNRAKQLSGFEEHHFTLGVRRHIFVLKIARGPTYMRLQLMRRRKCGAQLLSKF